MRTKIFLSLFIVLITLSNSAFSCGNWKNVKKCSTPEEALEVIKVNNPRYFDYESSKYSKERLSLFNYNENSITVTNFIKIEQKKRWQHFTFTLTAENPTYNQAVKVGLSNKKLMSVKVHYYKSLVMKGKRPLIVAFPTILKFETAEPLFAESMAKKGLSTMIPDVESIVDTTIPITELDKLMRRSIVQARMVIDLAHRDFSNELDASKIGTWGLSLGGIRAATLIGVDRRVTAAFIVSAGGNSADIFAASEQEYVVKYRNSKILEQGFARSDYFNFIRETSNVDPLFFAHRVPSEQMLMIMARNDVFIPTRNQLELWDAFGQPGPKRKNWKMGSHKFPIYQYVLLPWMKRRTFKFFKNRFNGIK